MITIRHGFLFSSGIALGIFLICIPSRAQLVTWGAAQTITGVGDISTSGTYVDAMNLSGVHGAGNNTTFTQVTIGDTIFHASTYGTLPGNPTTVGASFLASDGLNISAAVQAGYNAGVDGGVNFTSGTPSSSDYSLAVSNGAYLSSAGFTQLSYVTLSGLAVGHNYQVQVWTYLDATPTGSLDNTTSLSGTAPISLNPNAGNATAGGQFVIGTFTATSATLTFNWSYSGTMGPTQDSALLNDVALRDLTPVPEPSTWALLLGGIVTVGFLAGRRRTRGIGVRS